MKPFVSWVVSGLLLIGGVACAPQHAALREVRDREVDREVVPLCGKGLCVVVPEGPSARAATPTQAVAVEPPLEVEPAPEWLGNNAPDALPGPGDKEPLIIFEIHPDPPDTKLPPGIRALLAEETKKPYVRHHIFPQAFKPFFERLKINVHDWVMVLPLEEHLRIHRGARGGPWNEDWRQWIQEHRLDATREDVYRFAGEMIYRYCLVGTLTRYYCSYALPKHVPKNPLVVVTEDD